MSKSVTYIICFCLGLQNIKNGLHLVKIFGTKYTTILLLSAHSFRPEYGPKRRDLHMSHPICLQAVTRSWSLLLGNPGPKSRLYAITQHPSTHVAFIGGTGIHIPAYWRQKEIILEMERKATTKVPRIPQLEI